MSFAENVRAQALAMLGRGPLTHDQMNEILRLFAKYRSQLIQNTLLNLHGARVRGGPFAGMQFTSASAEGCHVPKLLGCYERELHELVEAAVTTGYQAIVNVGCAEGYYAVGLARRCPGARVVAHDANPGAQQACRELAHRNGVGERVTVAGPFAPETFRDYHGRRALFLIDVEGAELELLEGLPATELESFDFVVECHDCFRPKLSDRLAQRFAATHAWRLVTHEIRSTELPPVLGELGHLDQLLALWEWRSGPTPWLVMASRAWPDGAFYLAVVNQPTALPPAPAPG
jgi:hypothetical protein